MFCAVCVLVCCACAVDTAPTNPNRVYFDALSHSKLIEILSHTVKDGRVVSLIHKYLRSGVMNKGLFEASEEGILQGGPLSLLLSNIMLNELDKELERRGLSFVCYADDSMIFCKLKRAAMRVKKSITRLRTLYTYYSICPYGMCTVACQTEAIKRAAKSQEPFAAASFSDGASHLFQHHFLTASYE